MRDFIKYKMLKNKCICHFTMINRLIRNSKKTLAAIITFVMIFSFSGCSMLPINTGSDDTKTTSKETSIDTERPESDTVFTFDGENISLGEVYIYAETITDHYENLYGKGIWKLDVSATKDGSQILSDEIREKIISEIIRVKMLDKHASDYNISLNSTDISYAASETDAFYFDLTDNQIKEKQLDKELVLAVLEQNILADKVYDKIVSDAGIEVSDEEARETTFYDLCFSYYDVASNGDVTELSDNDKSAQHERALQAYNTLINPVDAEASGTSEANIEGLAEYYGLENADWHTMSPAEIKNEYGDKIKDVLYDLKNGSYSLVVESEYGYHIFYMKSLTDRDATNKKKEETLQTRRSSYINKIFDKWKKKSDPEFSYRKSVDQNIYKKVSF